MQSKAVKGMCVWLRVLTLEAVSFFFFAVEHHHHTVWSSKGVHCGRIIAYCNMQYDSDNDLLHIGIILLCEVLAPGLLNMHECLK